MQTKSRQIVKNLLYYDRVELITLNLFWIGYILYISAWSLGKTFMVSTAMCALIQLFGLMLFVPAAIRLIRFDFKNEYQKITFVLFFVWAVTILVRGLELDAKELRATVMDPWFGGFLYLAPLIMLFPKKLIYYKKVFDVIVILGIVYVLFDLRFLSALMEPDVDNVQSRAIVEYFSKNLAVPASFILLTYVYHSKRKNAYAIAILLLTLFFAIVRARRGLIFMVVCPFLFTYLLYWFNSKRKMLMLAISVGLLMMLGAGVIYFLSNYSGDIFSGIEERGVEDTRTGVELYFYGDMKGIDWVIGRGMNGEYYSPTMEEGNYRGTIETDYLNMILKGGLVNLGLLLLILVPAIFLGIFRSKNTLAKASGIWILIWLLNTYPSTVQVFSLYYLLVWIGAGICYSRTMRNIPERFLITYFQSLRSDGSSKQ